MVITKLNIDYDNYEVKEELEDKGKKIEYERKFTEQGFLDYKEALLKELVTNKLLFYPTVITEEHLAYLELPDILNEYNQNKGTDYKLSRYRYNLDTRETIKDIFYTRVEELKDYNKEKRYLLLTTRGYIKRIQNKKIYYVVNKKNIKPTDWLETEIKKFYIQDLEPTIKIKEIEV